MKKKPVNPTFAAMTWIRELSASTSEKAVLYGIASRIGADYSAWPSRRRLARDAGIKSLATVSKTTQLLEEKGFMQIKERTKKDGAQTSNQYLLLVPPQYKYSTLPASDLSGGSTESSLKLSSINQPSNYPVEEDYPQEKTGEVFHTSQGCALEKTQKEPGEEFPISLKYVKNVNSAKAAVCFWWNLLEHYRPNMYLPKKKLTKTQFRALMEILKLIEPPTDIMFVMETTVRDWEKLGIFLKSTSWGTDSKPPMNPSTTWILKNFGACGDYYLKYACT